MKRTVFSPEHEQFRDQFRRYVKQHVEPRVREWNAAGITDRESWRKIGEAGFLGVDLPVEYGGAGGDFLHAAIVVEELALARAHALQTSLHCEICMPYLLNYGSEAQKQQYLRPAIRG